MYIVCTLYTIYKLQKNKGLFSSLFDQRPHRQALDGLDQLELKARVNHLIEVLNRFLPADFTKTAIILKNIKDVWDYGNKDLSSGFHQLS